MKNGCSSNNWMRPVGASWNIVDPRKRGDGPILILTLNPAHPKLAPLQVTLDLADLGFDGVEPAATGRPAFHPSVLLKLYIYGHLNRVQSSRRLEREAGRNLELLWLLGRLVPDHKTIADFRKDNGERLRRLLQVGRVELGEMAGNALLQLRAPALHLALREVLVAVVDRLELAAVAKAKHVKEKLVKLKSEMDKLSAYEKQMLASPDQQISLTDPDSRSMATVVAVRAWSATTCKSRWRRRTT